MNIKHGIGVSTLCVTLSGPAMAIIPGAYIGGGMGNSTVFNFSDTHQITRNGLGGSVFIGFNTISSIGIELVYNRYAQASYRLAVVDYDHIIQFDYQLQSLGLIAKWYFPFGNKCPLNFYALLGSVVTQGQARLYDDSGTRYGSATSMGIAASGGIGLSYNINSHFFANIEYRFNAITKGNNSMIGIPVTALTTINLAYVF